MNKRDDWIFDRFKDYVKQFFLEFQIIIGNEYVGFFVYVFFKVMFFKYVLYLKGLYSVVILVF